MSFIFAEVPTAVFLDNYLCVADHTLFNVKHCGADATGTIEGLNRTVLRKLPQSISLIKMESVLMGVAFLSMLMILTLCGPAYRPTEEIDLRSIGWGNIFQLPFKHMRDYRLRHLTPFFIYSGFEVLFACTGFAL
ncbi:protein unc-93 homolog B1-like, partial [Hypanus sabinus]|uniref:protein unc-93 homolog B1-like n=1 Tax=Hypanus sabinus TaxID=79690 RepID=UPI0028C50D41